MELFEEINKELKTAYKSNDELNWNLISLMENLKYSFIEKYNDRINWDYISRFQVLSESFIEKWENKVNWGNISQYQRLSKEFIEKYKGKLDLNALKLNTLIQTDIGKNWFIAYTDEFNIKCIEDYNNNEDIKLFQLSESKNMSSSITFNLINKIFTHPDFDYFVRIKINYKDIISYESTLKFKIIRITRKYKICGKKENNYEKEFI